MTTPTLKGAMALIVSALIFSVAGTTHSEAAQKDPSKGKGHETGLASYYASFLAGNATANGESYSPDALTAAHPTLPLGSMVKVTNLSNGRAVLVRINDRGPFSEDRVIDLSEKAARTLKFHNNGVTRVRIEPAGS